MATWEEYTKPKYKEALARWNKETGGGDGTLPSFAKYACASWLAWVFCLDSEFDFLLASCSEGRVPKHMSNEGGWVDPLPIDNDNDDAEHGGNQKGTKKEKALLTTIASLNGMTNTLSAHLEVIANAIKAKVEAKSEAKTPAKKKKVTSAYCLEKVAKIKKDQQMIEKDNDITPLTKKRSLENLVTRKKQWLQKSFTAASSDKE